MLDPSKKEDLKTFYTKRLSRILTTLLFWSALFLLLAMLRGIVKGEPVSLIDLLKRLLSGKPYYHMWFLYMIVPLYLFTPFFRKIVANSSRNELIIFVLSAFVIAALNTISSKPLFSFGSKLFITWFLPYIPFFFLGYLIRTDEREYPKLVLWIIFILSSFLTAVGCYTVASSKGLYVGLYFYDYLSITVIPMSVSIMYLMKSWTKPIVSAKLTRTVSVLALGVYLIHPVFLESISYIVYTQVDFSPAISVPVATIATFSFSLFGAWLIYNIPYLNRII